MPRPPAGPPTRRSARVATRAAARPSAAMDTAPSSPSHRLAGAEVSPGADATPADPLLDPAVLIDERRMTTEAAVGLVSLAHSPVRAPGAPPPAAGAASQRLGTPLFLHVSPQTSPGRSDPGRRTPGTTPTPSPGKAAPALANDTTPEREARWARAQARDDTPTPTPDPDEVVDAFLRDSRARSASGAAESPQRVTPPPIRTPTPPQPQDQFVPAQVDILAWFNSFSPVVLLCLVARRFWPEAWDVPATWDVPARLKLNLLSRLTEGSAPWPTWTCSHCARLDIPCFPSTFADPTTPRGRISRKCVRCAEVDHRDCERDIPRHPSHIYTGDALPHLLAPGVRGVVRAHLITPDSRHGLGSIRSDDRTVDPRDRYWFFRAMEIVWRTDRRIARKVVETIYDYMTRQADLHSEREPFESVSVPGGPPEPIGTRIPFTTPVSPPPAEPTARRAPRRRSRASTTAQTSNDNNV